ncbi:hypothetical protein I302_100280 [Kwoniella bestiolae CBS 10118]|uniref:EF-hand domain-containing protein n=1 Tax=Kwoniella bestiolae CBS 10118 TaxID=1296100 RepID=A0AAJ8M4Q5_9TREE
MQSRPRRAAASSSTLPTRTEDPNVDPEFLTLSANQRRNIDRAFGRGIAILEGRSRKRRKVEKKGVEEKDEEQEQGGFVAEDNDEGGGFLVDDEGDGGAGGFMVDNDEAGGFMVEDEGGGFMVDDEENGGGFMIEDDPIPSNPNVQSEEQDPFPPKRIPLHLLPSLLTSLGLPSDEDVLGVFKASASGWEDEEEQSSSSRRKRGPNEEGGGGGVELKDFRAVCAALMGPDDAQGEEEDGEEDTFELPSEDGESDLSSLSGSEYGEDSASKSTKKRTGKVRSKDFASEGDSSTPAPAARRRGRKNIDVDSSGRVRLNTRQKELAKDIWEMLKPPSTTQKGQVLGRDEVKKWVRELGEMWSDDEITEMVTLFSTQHEGRGLTFDDFSGVMLRAGLV